MDPKILLRLPSVKEYNDLRRLAEWPVFDEALVKEALSNTLFSVIAYDGAEPIGMGRVVGDKAIYLHIADVIVHPNFQGKGVGRLIMNEIMKYIESTGGRNTNIGLMASKGREAFYQRFGFIERPAEKFGAGMIMVKK
jgi:GNAT superfamily N-acetyltransferase